MSKPTTILVADDDADDRMLITEALEESRLANAVHFVESGEQLIAYLLRQDQFADLAGQPLPGIVLLDLNMPKKDGREALAEIKADPVLRRIPVVVLTSSVADEDVVRSYGLGVSSFINKPVSFESLVDVVRTLKNYWLEIVTVPRG